MGHPSPLKVNGRGLYAGLGLCFIWMVGGNVSNLMPLASLRPLRLCVQKWNHAEAQRTPSLYKMIEPVRAELGRDTNAVETPVIQTSG